MIYALLAIAVALTFTMFHTKQMMLGFPSAMFWAILGGHSYTLSAFDWDVYYFLFFASAFGMTVFCIFAAYGLREAKDEGSDKGDFIDEGKEDGQYIDEGKGEEGEPVSKRTRRLRARAKDRRNL